MRSPASRAAVVAIAVAASSFSMSPASAAESGWSKAYESAAVTGNRHTERELPFSVLSTLVIKGKLKNTGNECYSLWAKLDIGSVSATRAATQCGPGAATFNLRSVPSMSPNGTLFLCRGEGTQDCGPRFSAREFPVSALPMR
ncbi:hypothetical protein ACFXKW_11750 [Streptomyces sp. NPDC059193]|uniref:hypothetical protein n=1 Tax=Streptomyces sp. NPDC059193 TaxID=3346763 RepID=UPI0036D058F3